MTSPATSMNSTTAPKIDLDELLSVEEAAAVSGLSPATVRRMAADGRIQGKKIGDAWVVTRSSLPFITDAAAIVIDIEQAIYDEYGTGQTRDQLPEAVRRLAVKAHLYDEAVSAYNRAVGGGSLSTTLGYALGGLHGVRQIQPGGVAVQLTSSNWAYGADLSERVQSFGCSDCGTAWLAQPGVPTYCPNDCQAKGRPSHPNDGLPMCSKDGLPHVFKIGGSMGDVCTGCGNTPDEIRNGGDNPVPVFGVFEDAQITTSSKVTFSEDAVNDLRDRL
jgi:excisionase family DNA binding protein